MKKKLILGFACGLLLLGMIGTANATLIIHELSITSTNVSFDLTGTVEKVGTVDLDSLFFGFVLDQVWIKDDIDTVMGLSSNSGDYAFYSVTGRSNSSTYGSYLWTRTAAGTNTLGVGDQIDLRIDIDGEFDLTGLDIMDFKVQAGFIQPPFQAPSSSNHIIQQANITGGVGTLAAPVPEPATMLLFGLGLLGLAGVNRRKK